MREGDPAPAAARPPTWQHRRHGAEEARRLARGDAARGEARPAPPLPLLPPASAAPAPAALRRQTQQRSGSAALRDALEAASAAGAMTLHVRVADVADAIAELDELRARLDRAETRA